LSLSLRKFLSLILLCPIGASDPVYSLISQVHFTSCAVVPLEILDRITIEKRYLAASSNVSKKKNSGFTLPIEKNEVLEKRNLK
jgi:hypothetical protein